MRKDSYTSSSFNLSLNIFLSAILFFPQRKPSFSFRRFKMSSRAEGHLRPSSEHSDSSRTTSNVSSRSAQSARSTQSTRSDPLPRSAQSARAAGPAQESPRHGGTGTRQALSPFQIVQLRASDRRPPGRASPRPSDDLTHPTPENMNRESPTQQQQQRQQQIPSSGPTRCTRCKAFLDRQIEDPDNCLTAGVVLASICTLCGVCLTVFGD